MNTRARIRLRTLVSAFFLAAITMVGGGPPLHAGVLEAEDFLVGISGGWVIDQDMTGFPGQWSGDMQVLWSEGGPHGQLAFVFEVDAAGKYEIYGGFTAARDYGIFTHLINGQLGTPLDLYSPGVLPTGPVYLGQFDLNPGANQWFVQTSGTNPLANPVSYSYGLDYIVLTQVPEAPSRRVPLVIDPAQSYVTLSVDVEGIIPFEEQAPGSMTSALYGSLTADLFGEPGAWTDVRFHATGDIRPVGHEDSFLPGNLPADLAGTVNIGDETEPVLAYIAFRGSSAALSSGFVGLDGQGGFALDGLLMSLTSTLDYDIAGLITGSTTATLSSLLNGQGSVVQNGDSLSVTIPFDLQFQSVENGVLINYNYSGQIVATAHVVPEPSTLLLAGCGALGIFVFGARRVTAPRIRRAKRAASRGALVLLGACLATCWPAGVCQAVPLKVMSFNILHNTNDADNPGSNTWFNSENPADARRLRAFSVIGDQAPDILGLQEVTTEQLADLKGQYISGQGLLDYDNYAVDRGDGEYDAAIFYRRDRFTRVDQGTFWMSHTPDVPGSQFPSASWMRIASWVVLEDHQTGVPYFVLNTHLDHANSEARTLSGALIQTKLQELSGGLPILVTGDFNANETSAALLALTAPTAPGAITLTDPYRIVHPVRTFFEYTGNGLAGLTFGSRIDFVLSSADFTPTDAAIVRTSYDGKWPSDHYPVTATFDVTPVPEPGTFALAGSGLIVLSVFARQWLGGRRRADSDFGSFVMCSKALLAQALWQGPSSTAAS